MDAGTPAITEAWTCTACGHANEPARLCDRCGVSRSWSEDPPLDAPPAPAFFERPAGWLALLHGAAAALGLLLLARPTFAPLLALAPPFQLGQVLLSAAAAWASANHAAMERLFWRIELDVPARVPAGREIVARARVVPYAARDRTRVAMELRENTYERDPDPRRATVRTRTKVLARHTLLSGGRLPGRRTSEFEAHFAAPIPTGGHRDVRAELQASLLGAFAWLVPGLGETARNLREHGGVWVRLTVRRGPWRRRLEERVLVYHLSADRFEVA